jgi:hypothetical protein
MHFHPQANPPKNRAHTRFSAQKPEEATLALSQNPAFGAVRQHDKICFSRVFCRE